MLGTRDVGVNQTDEALDTKHLCRSKIEPIASDCKAVSNFSFQNGAFNMAAIGAFAMAPSHPVASLLGQASQFWPFKAPRAFAGQRSSL